MNFFIGTPSVLIELEDPILEKEEGTSKEKEGGRVDKEGIEKEKEKEQQRRRGGGRERERERRMRMSFRQDLPEEESADELPSFPSNSSIAGTVFVLSKSSFAHKGIKIYFIGCIGFRFLFLTLLMLLPLFALLFFSSLLLCSFLSSCKDFFDLEPYFFPVMLKFLLVQIFKEKDGSCNFTKRK